mmetsp:Transcript_13285/g.23901  ORF Transcript_13285/g.23901 Transcript_13285/m.23901 type:complete len:208 (+) Transcript_13285:3-626(+)
MMIRRGSFSCYRYLSSSPSLTTRAVSSEVTGPTQKLKSWESGARLVKNTHVENQYLEHIRDIHDPSLHLKTIEDELKGTIGKALGKQGEKVLMYARLMNDERQRYDELLEQHDGNRQHEQVQNCAKKHNQYRKDCIQARWELIVHRQAVGFIVGNHQYVTNKFPIGEALPEDEGNETKASSSEENSNKPKKVFGDQLDWWQRIGRWR